MLNETFPKLLGKPKPASNFLFTAEAANERAAESNALRSSVTISPTAERTNVKTHSKSLISNFSFQNLPFLRVL